MEKRMDKMFNWPEIPMWRDASCVLQCIHSHDFHFSTLHCKKKVSDIPVPSRDVTSQTLNSREKLNYWFGQ